MCLSSVFPFNHIGDDSEFYKAIYTKDIWNVDLLDLSDKVFNPLENLDRELNDLLDEYDPDLNFYNEIYQKSMHKCNYLTESSFKDKLSLSKCIAAASFSLCHINIRSLNRNLDDFIFLTESIGFEFSILGFSETWLRDDNCDLYGIPVYSICEKHRHNAIGGGVAIYVMHDITYTERCDISYFDECMESVFIEIPRGVFQMDKNIIVGTVYRPPGTNLDKFHRRMEEIIIKIQKENKKCYIMGDYNINLMNYDVHAATAEFTDMMYANSFVPLINRPTRITESSATLIDNIFSNDLDGLTNGIQCILVTDISDHFPVVYINEESKKQEKGGNSNETHSFFWK